MPAASVPFSHVQPSTAAAEAARGAAWETQEEVAEAGGAARAKVMTGSQVSGRGSADRWGLGLSPDRSSTCHTTPC